MVTLETLPLPPTGKAGWPWTQASPVTAPNMPDGGAWPKISVVVPSFNQGEFLEETLRSILLQGYPNLEILVIDGGSRDTTKEVLRRYAQFLDYQVSEPDGGQADAVNKGFERATGEIFNFINSDDVLLPGILAEIAMAMVGHDLVAGANLVVQNVITDHFPERVACRDMSTKNLILGNGVFQQQPIWWRRDFAARVGVWETKYRYIFDIHFLIRSLAFKPEINYIDHDIAYFRFHATSKTVAEHVPMAAELSCMTLHLSLSAKDFETQHWANLRARQISWWKFLADLQESRLGSRLSRCGLLLRRMASDPPVALNRMGISFFFKLLLGLA